MTTIIATATNNALVARHIQVISAKTGSTLMGASKAFLIEEAKRQMRSGVCHFIYLKKNGDVREAMGTLSRPVLNATLKGPEARRTIGMLPYSVNEVALHRSGSSVLGINVSIDGEPLPTYWADGLLVATSSGSTAYSLSVGGPICMPDTKVLVLAPISPHNLNVRPIVIPETAKIDISFESRDGKATMSMDNRVEEIQTDWTIHVEMAQFSLKRVRLPESGFVKALTSRLFWGEDMRNNE